MCFNSETLINENVECGESEFCRVIFSPKMENKKKAQCIKINMHFDKYCITVSIS